MGDHRRSRRIYFHAIGIGGQDTTNGKGWTIKTLKNIKKSLGHENVSNLEKSY